VDGDHGMTPQLRASDRDVSPIVDAGDCLAYRDLFVLWHPSVFLTNRPSKRVGPAAFVGVD
jgi:hypothetical protein